MMTKALACGTFIETIGADSGGAIYAGLILICFFSYGNDGPAIATTSHTETTKHNIIYQSPNLKKMEKQQLLKSSDRHVCGEFAPEVIGFSFFHLPKDESAVNGFKFDIRIGEKSFNIKVLEGESKDENSQSVAYLASGDKFLELIQDRHQQISEVQTQVLDQATSMLSLLDDIQSK